MVPSTEASAVALPEMPAKKPDDRMETDCMPPRRWPTMARAMATTRSVTPPTFISAPASRNRGMVSQMNWSIPARLRCGSIRAIIQLSDRCR